MRLAIYTALVGLALAAPAQAACTDKCNTRVKVKTIKKWRSGLLPKKGELTLSLRVRGHELESEQVGRCRLRFYGEGIAAEVVGCKRLRIRFANSTGRTKIVTVKYSIN